MLLTFDVFCCCGEKGYQSTISLSFLFFQENGTSLENKAVISASSSPLPLNSTVLPSSQFWLKKIPLQVLIKKKSLRNQGRMNPWMMQDRVLNRDTGLARPWMGQREEKVDGFFQGLQTCLHTRTMKETRTGVVAQYVLGFCGPRWGVLISSYVWLRVCLSCMKHQHLEDAQGYCAIKQKVQEKRMKIPELGRW